MVIPSDVAAFIGRQGDEQLRFDIALLDPPYADSEMRDRALAWLGGHGAPLTPGARVVVKHFWRDQPPAGVGLLASERSRRFGETALTFYRRQEDG
jgi:16S rRNA G966 N2-methylase RsmD